MESRDSLLYPPLPQKHLGLLVNKPRFNLLRLLNIIQLLKQKRTPNKQPMNLQHLRQRIKALTVLRHTRVRKRTQHDKNRANERRAQRLRRQIRQLSTESRACSILVLERNLEPLAIALLEERQVQCREC